jgi:hypothetical protein
MDLQKQVEEFADRWGPHTELRYAQFVVELRELMEAYGRAAIEHESLPDTEHEHGAEV